MKKGIQIVIILLAFTGLLINVLVSTLEDPVSLGRGLGLFRYYTLQSNLIVLIYFVLLFLDKTRYKIVHKFIGAVVVYITITFVIYTIMLAPTYHPTGWNMVSNILAHYMVPILTIFYFFYFKNKYDFKPKDALVWIVYPVIYIVFMLIYGMITNDYLYPFFQVKDVGILGLIITIFILFIVFVLLSFLVMKIVSLQEKQKTI